MRFRSSSLLSLFIPMTCITLIFSVSVTYAIFVTRVSLFNKTVIPKWNIVPDFFVRSNNFYFYGIFLFLIWHFVYSFLIYKHIITSWQKLRLIRANYRLYLIVNCEPWLWKVRNNYSSKKLKTRRYKKKINHWLNRLRKWIKKASKFLICKQLKVYCNTKWLR